MGGSLNQPCRVQEEGLMDCKLLFFENNKEFANFDAGIEGKRIG